jgi:cytochrome c oxidase subunit 3
MSIFSYKHGFHLSDPSPWPFISSFSALFLTFGAILYMHGYNTGFVWRFGFFMIIYMMFVWWRDIIREGTFEGHHTFCVQNGLKMGMLLFIVSEIMFFFAFFWAFFHFSLNPGHTIGCVWPPAFLNVLDAKQVPLLNTVILLTSGATITWAHNAIICGSRNHTIIGLICTILLAIVFTGFQLFEYLTTLYTMSDGIYGSVFYMATGFHGFHVFIGTCFLAVCLVRLYCNHFSCEHHFGFEAAIWYWHFVDVVWLFLFVTIYWWGS